MPPATLAEMADVRQRLIRLGRALRSRETATAGRTRVAERASTRSRAAGPSAIDPAGPEFMAGSPGGRARDAGVRGRARPRQRDERGRGDRQRGSAREPQKRWDGFDEIDEATLRAAPAHPRREQGHRGGARQPARRDLGVRRTARPGETGRNRDPSLRWVLPPGLAAQRHHVGSPRRGRAPDRDAGGRRRGRDDRQGRLRSRGARSDHHRSPRGRELPVALRRDRARIDDRRPHRPGGLPERVRARARLPEVRVQAAAGPDARGHALARESVRRAWSTA